MSTSATTATTTTRKNKSLNKLRSLGLSHQNNNNDDGGGVGGKIIPTTNNNNNPLQHLQILQNVEQLTRESRSSSSGSEGRNNVLRDNLLSQRQHEYEHGLQSSTTTAAAMSTTTTREDYNATQCSLDEEGEDDGNNNKATTATTRSGGVELVAPHSTLSRVRSSELFIDNNNNNDTTNNNRKLSIMRNKLQHKLMNNVSSSSQRAMKAAKVSGTALNMKGSFKKKKNAAVVVKRSVSPSSSLVPFDEEQPFKSSALLQQPSSSLSTTTLKSAAKQQHQSNDNISTQTTDTKLSSSLPNGWKRAMDYKTQKYYYYHFPSNKVSWEVPSDLKDFQVTKKLDSSNSSISEKERKVYYYKENDCKREAKVEKKRNVSARSNTTKENNNSVKVAERVVSRRGRSATRNYNNNGEKKQRRASSLKATSKYSTYTSITTTTCSHLDSTTTLEQQQQRRQLSKSSSKRVTFQEDQVDNTKQQQRTNRRRRSSSSPSLQFSSLFNVKRAKERKSLHRGSFSPTTRNNDSSSGRRRKSRSSSSSPSIVKMNKFITRVSDQVQLQQQRGGCLSPNIPNIGIRPNLVTLRDGLLSSLQCGGGIGGQVGGLSRCTPTAIEVDDDNENEEVMVNRVNSLLLFDDDDDDDKSTQSLLGVEEEEKKANLTMMMKSSEAFEVRYKGVNESQYCSSSSESLDDDDHAKDDDNNKRRGRRNTFLSSSSRPPLRRLSMTTSPSSRSFEALNLMKSRLAKNKIQSSESLSSIKLPKLRNPDAPLLLVKNSAKKCFEQQQKILSFRNNNHHRRTMSGGNVLSKSVVAQSLSRRSASFSLNRSVASLMTDDDDNGRDREVRKEEGGLPDGSTREGKDDDDSLDIIDDPWGRRTRSINTPTGKARTSPGSERRGGEGVKSQMQGNLFQQHNRSINILHDSQVGDSVQWKARITESDSRDLDQTRVVETSGQDQEEGDGEEMKECQHRRDVSTESPTGVDELTTFDHRDSSLPSPGTCSPSNLEERLKQCNNEDESGTRASNAADDDGGSTGVPRTIKASAKTTINASNVELELIEEEVDSNNGDEEDCQDKVAEKVAGAKENSNAQDTAAAALLMRQQQKYEFEAFEVKYRSLPPKQRAYEEALLTLKSKAKERLHIRAHPAAAKSVNKSNVRVTININEDDNSIAFTSSTSNWRDEDNRSVSTIASSVEDFNKSRSMEEEDVNSMSAMYSQDEDKMHERKICTKDILNEGNNILDDFNTVSAESALTTDSPNNELLLGWDIPPELPEGQNSSNTRKNEKNGKSTRDCNYGTTMETAYEDFGVERQLAKVSEEGKKIRQGVKIPFSQKPKFGLPFPRSNPVDVDELSLSVASLADDSVKDVSVGELVQADTINCICGDWNVAEGVKTNAACGDVDDLPVRDTTNAVIEWDGDIDKIGVPDEPIFDKIIDVLDIAMNGYDKACDVEYDCRTEYDGQTEFDGQTMHDGKTIDGLGFDDGETICHGDNSDEEDGNDSQKTYPPRQKEAIANTDAIKMQGLVFVSPNAENPNTAYLSSEGL